MKKIFCIFLAGLFVFNVFGKKTDIVSVQSQQLREMCRKIQELEQSISNAESEIEKINTKERNCVPFVRSIYEMLTRCFTTLFDIQRFSNILAINQTNNKNDFVRCLIIIKNFTSYFKFVSSQLCENNSEMTELKKNKTSFYDKLDKNKREYEELKKNLFCIVNNIGKDSEETIIQNVVYHIATKCTSIDELDAELESENAIGVLKNAKIATNLCLKYPVSGKIVGEFGDKGKNGEMLCQISFKTRPGAIVTSPAKGLIVFSGKFLNYGNMVILSNGEYRIFLYGMESITVSAADVVEIGDYIGKMGDKANATIVNMELRKSGDPLDPRHWLLDTIEKENK